jgi:hypothetical protein
MVEDTLELLRAAGGRSGERPSPAAQEAAPAASEPRTRLSRGSGTVAVVAREGAAGAQTAWQINRREWAPRSMFALSAVLILGSLALMLFPELPVPLLPSSGRQGQQGIDQHSALLVIIACALPPLLAWLSYLLINKRAVCEHVRPHIASNLASELSPDPAEPALIERANSTWWYEIGKAQWFLSRAQVFAGLWGMIATIAIVGGVSFLVPPFRPVGAPFREPYSMVALAVIAAASTSFLLDLARLCIRTANDDATKRMFAEALRTLILSVVSTLALILLIRFVGPEQMSVLFKGNAIEQGKDVEVCLIALGLGAGVAVLGPPVFDWIQMRVATALGIESKKHDGGTPLFALADISDAEIARLGEEGIESVEALVSTSIPRLFLNTRFSLQRIVAWHDFGLLVVRIGATAAGDLRSRWGICGAVEIRRVVRNPAASGAAATLRDIFKKNMRVDGDAEAELVLRQIADDERVALTELQRRTVFEKYDEPGRKGSAAGQVSF